MKSAPQQKLLRAIRKNPNATVRELQKTCKMSSTSVVDYHLTKMMAKGVIRKGNKWEIVKTENPMPKEGV